MRFVYGKQDIRNRTRSQENCWLMTNGRGGYASLSAAFSATRGDQGILISAQVAPTVRYTLVQSVKETVQLGRKKIVLSENGFRYLTTFVWDDGPVWIYEINGVTLKRRAAMKPGENTTAILYDISNHADIPCRFSVVPGFLCLPKGQTRTSMDTKKENTPFFWDHEKLSCSDPRCQESVWMKASGEICSVAPSWTKLSYQDDRPDGRTPEGWNYTCVAAQRIYEREESGSFSMIFSDAPIKDSAEEILAAFKRHERELEQKISFQDPVARQLAKSANAYITDRDSTGEKTIVAGYPFFADWGRDTMISLPGCVMAAGQLRTAESILQTFLHYERKGLVPNLFPEGGEKPRYNTVDAALLLIHCVWLYYQRTNDLKFLKDAYPVLQNIIEGYCEGTDHAIKMEGDCLISAGEGLDQVTWMDVCIDGILPTPRHGKPVEINAYWYNALCVMSHVARLLGEAGLVKTLDIPYGQLAVMVKESFLRAFWIEKDPKTREGGYLRDVISGTKSDEQIRCNQIWAVSMPFSMLSIEQEKQVVDTVYRHLYTPCGLRTLSPKDPEFHPTYHGDQKQRDMAYHQGTVWVFPLGAFYRSYLKVEQYSKEARDWVKERLESIEPMLREGCIGQLPEIYDGEYPNTSKGCFAQAWSVGEILTVYELLEETEKKEEADVS